MASEELLRDANASAHPQLGHLDAPFLRPQPSNPEERGQATPGKYVVLDSDRVNCRQEKCTRDLAGRSSQQRCRRPHMVTAPARIGSSAQKLRSDSYYPAGPSPAYHMGLQPIMWLVVRSSRQVFRFDPVPSAVVVRSGSECGAARRGKWSNSLARSRARRAVQTDCVEWATGIEPAWPVWKMGQRSRR